MGVGGWWEGEGGVGDGINERISSFGIPRLSTNSRYLSRERSHR